MNIAFIAPANSIHTVKWVNSLGKRGHMVTLYSLACHKANELIANNIEVICLPGKAPAGYFTAAPRLKKLLRSRRFDVVNAHYASGYGTLARLSNAHPLLLNVWGSDVYDFPYESKLNGMLLRKNLLFADRLASTSNVMAAQVKRFLKNPDLEIDITPFGVDTVSAFSPERFDKRQMGRPVIGIIKTLEPKYGIEYLIEAFSMVSNRWEGMGSPLLEIYGRGSQLQELQALTEKLDIADQVSFKGFIEHTEVPAALSRFDLFVASSSESFGVAVVEAMAMGLPVVATDADGFTEVVQDGVTGIIVPRKNSTALADAIYDMLTHPDCMHQMGKAGRERAVKLYEWEKNVDTMEEIYRRLSGITYNH